MEQRTAEYLLVKPEQQQFFSEQITAVKKEKRDELKDRLGLYFDNQILQCAGRYQYLQMPEDQNYPTLISHQCELALIGDAHLRTMHMRLQSTLTELRQRWWITKGRATVKKYLRQCIICKRYQGKPYELSRIPPIPTFKSDRCRPFKITVLVKSEDNTHTKIKRWVCLFTYLLIRNIHLEVVHDMSNVRF